MINESLLLIVLLSIIYFKNQSYKNPLILLYLLLCIYYYFGLNQKTGLYGLIVFLFCFLTGIIKNNQEDYHNCEDDEHFKNSISNDDDEAGIEQFGIQDQFSTLHNMIHKLTKPK
jgi:hypothetical protein